MPLDFVFAETEAAPNAVVLGKLGWWMPLDGGNMANAQSFLNLLGMMMQDEKRLEC